MIKAKCINKIRNKNSNIIEYKLINKNKKIISVKSDDLKEYIRSGQIEVNNLTLDSDNRLIDKKPDTPLKPNVNVEAMINRIKILGYILNTFDTACGHKCYIASLPDNSKHLFLIPDDVKYIYKSPGQDIYNTKLFEYMSCTDSRVTGGTLRVVGGKNLISTRSMFKNCKIHSIDLSSFNTSKVTDMSYMFSKCEAQSIDLRSFDTSNATTMERMFWLCKVQHIDLSSFNTSKVTDMSYMFSNCKAQSIDLSSFDTSNVTNMRRMFNLCEAQSFDLRSFNTGNVANMHDMFFECKAHSIDLSSFDTSNVTNMRRMFYSCAAQYIDLSSFNTSNITDIEDMFGGCEAQINVNCAKLKSQLQKDKEATHGASS